MDKTAVKIISYFDGIEELLIGLLFFSLPFGWTLSIVPMVLFTITLFINVFTKPEKPSKEKILYFAPLLAIFIWNAFSMTYTADKNEGIQTLTTQVTLLITALAFLFNRIPSKSVIKAFYLFLIGCFCSILILLGIATYKSSSIIGDAFVFRPFFEQVSGGVLDTDTNGNYFLGQAFSHFSHPAYMGLLLSIAMYIIVRYLRINSNTLGNKSFWLVAFTLFGISLISFSLNGTLLLATSIVVVCIGILSIRKMYYGELSQSIYVILFFFITLIAINPQIHKVIDKQPSESITQRMTITEISWELVSENWVTGVGIGDDKTSMLNKYIEHGETTLAKKKLNSHNQFMTTWIQSGIIGLLMLLWAFATLVYRGIKTQNNLITLFAFNFFLSFLFESMLVRYTGVITFTLFYGIMYFHSQDEVSTTKSYTGDTYE